MRKLKCSLLALATAAILTIGFGAQVADEAESTKQPVPTIKPFGPTDPDVT